MRLAFNTFICPNWTLKALLAAGQQHGYHGVEFRCDAQQAHGVEVHIDRSERKAIRRMIQQSSLEPILLASSMRLLDEHLMDDAPLRLQLASDIGAKAVRVFCGPPAWRQEYEESLFEQKVIQSLGALAEMAQPLDLEIWLETHDSLTSGPEIARLLDQVNHPRLGVLYDMILPWRNGHGISETITSLGSRIRHVHFHDGMKRQDQLHLTPLGQGQVPLADVIKGLSAIGYDSHLSAEWFEPIYGQDVHESLEQYRLDVLRVAGEQGVTVI